MNKIIGILLIIIFSYSSLHAQFNPDVSAKSLVKVQVKGTNKINVCSGFLWKNENWVVTSLHAMQKDAKIQVQYLNSYWRDARVIKVLPAADLVLLQTNTEQQPLPVSVPPIKDYGRIPVKFPEKLYAQGYHGGAHGHRTQSLEKGHADPETLEFIVVKEDSKQLLQNLGIPQMNLPILYLNGSLLPGYSGAPIYNQKGELIGIGDGGLEGGQVNVSWAIPAKYLIQLESSLQNTLPSNIDQIALLFSAQLQIESTNTAQEDIQQQLADKYTSYSGGPFEFYKTKTRSFEEMYSSSIDPENLDYFADEFYENNLVIDYRGLRFDIYEDVNNGVIIALPEGSGLIYQETTGTYISDLSNYPLSEFFILEFAGLHDADRMIENVDVAADLLLSELNMAYGAAVNGFYEDEEYSYSFDIGNGYEIAYILFSGNNFYMDEYGNTFDLKMYLTVLWKDQQVFYTMSTINLPVYQLADAMNYGIDCLNNYTENSEYCEYFQQLMRVIAASHLTTFANMQFVADR